MWVVVGLVGCSDFSLEQVKPPPVDGERLLVANPDVVDFGVLASMAPVVETVTVEATGDLPVTLAAFELTGAQAYTVTAPGAGTVVEPGATVDFVVTYTPASFDDEARLVIHSDAAEPTIVVPLVGAGTFPAIQVQPSSVYFTSEYGEAVTEDVVVTSIGTADLSISSMYVEGAWFSAEGLVPVTLAPGESTTLTARYSPEVEGELVNGKIWLTTNTPEGFAVVPLEGFYGVPCIGLGEAWDRGLLDVATLGDGVTLDVSNAGLDDELCVDRWYVYLSTGSQDLGAGDMDADFGDPYPYGSLEIAPTSEVLFEPGAASDRSWWCMEATQLTDRLQDYTFIGAYVPEPLLTYMIGMDQDAVWGWMDANPVMIAARGTHYVEVPRGGGTAEVALRVLNMGSVAGTAEVRESVPAGWTASAFSVSPDRTEIGREGAIVHVWDVNLAARVQGDLDEQTVYDERVISYTLQVPPCAGRQYADEMTTAWTDSDGVQRVASANPLVVNCVE